MTCLFISDLHLDGSRARVTDAFVAFLSGPARDAATLFILGDLFEAWVGDDAPTAHDRRVIEAIGAYTRAGHRCRLLRGNRDFLLGARFATDCGVELLAGPCLVEIDGERALVTHGDELCTADRGYQRLRHWLRKPSLQQAFLSLPPRLRRGVAGWLRARSAASHRGKSPLITDVSPDAVKDCMRRHGVSLLIHGHTHRPAIHEFDLDGRPARRIVLGDWYDQGSVLQLGRDGAVLQTLPYARAAP